MYCSLTLKPFLSRRLTASHNSGKRRFPVTFRLGKYAYGNSKCVSNPFTMNVIIELASNSDGTVDWVSAFSSKVICSLTSLRLVKPISSPVIKISVNTKKKKLYLIEPECLSNTKSSLMCISSTINSTCLSLSSDS